MSFNDELWNKILTWMVPTALSGVFFLAGFTAKVTYQVEKLEQIQLLNTHELNQIRSNRYKDTDFARDIKPIETDMRYIQRDIKEIKDILKSRN